MKILKRGRKPEPDKWYFPLTWHCKECGTDFKLEEHEGDSATIWNATFIGQFALTLCPVCQEAVQVRKPRR